MKKTKKQRDQISIWLMIHFGGYFFKALRKHFDFLILILIPFEFDCLIERLLAFCANLSFRDLHPNNMYMYLQVDWSLVVMNRTTMIPCRRVSYTYMLKPVQTGNVLATKH